jgi:hypothetical protein
MRSSRWERGKYSGEEVDRQRDPTPAAALLDGATNAPARVRLVQVAAAKPLLLELADAHPGRVKHEHSERVHARDERQHGLDLVSGGRSGLLALLARETDVNAIAGGVLLDARVVQHLREHRQALADRLALTAGRVESRDELGDFGRRDLIDAPSAQHREDAAELDAVPDRGSLRDVDARGAPALGRFRERRCAGRRLLELPDAGCAHRGQLAGHPGAPCKRLAPGRERAGVTVGALPTTEPILDPVRPRELLPLPPIDST